MASEILMPKMGYDMESGTILRWLKKEGDPITKGEPVAEIQTDKVAIEIEAFATGVLAKILVPEGQDAPVGSPIGIIAAKGEKVEAAPVAEAAPAAKAGPAKPLPPADKSPAAAVRDPEPPLPPADRSPASEVREGAAPLGVAPPARAAGERLFASPLAKKIAAEQGLDLNTITGSGPGGRIVRKDVETAAVTPAAAPAVAPGAAKAPTASARVPLSPMRKAIVRKMVESKAPVPHFYVTMAVRMDAAMALREQINAGREKDQRISVNDFVVKACALALRQHPSLNAVFDGDAIVNPAGIAISVAVAIPDGLIAPDIHDADTKSIGTIAAEVRDKALRARDGKLTPEEYGRGSFTVSNLGMYGVEAFTAIITLPQSAAIAVGAVAAEPVVVDGALAVGQVMRFTVSADHRVTDGAGSAQFAAAVKKHLENPLQLLL